jgi:hypothetical protein
VGKPITHCAKELLMTTETPSPNPAAAQTSPPSPAAAKTTVTPIARWKRDLKDLQANARARLQGTRAAAVVEGAERLVQRLPHAAKDEVDVLLDRVGLVRKARVTSTASQASPAAPTGAAAPSTPSQSSTTTTAQA